ncbi:MAG: radical SAM protein [Nitrospirae bacterium]|nr:radical SAM protein [Nitrospirota bacterium]
MAKNVIIEANANFHHIAGEDLFRRQDERFQDYRRKWKEWPETFHVGEFPLFIDIEVTSACNLKCPFCATTFRGSKIRRGFISEDTVRKVIDEGAEKGLYGVKFNIRGEPLLHPKLHEFVGYAKAKGLIDVYFNTNAMLLDRGWARRLIDAGLDRLSISFEGYTKEVYERHRPGAVFETVIENIEGIQSLKRKLGVGHPKVRVQTVLLPELKGSFKEYKAFWSDKADEVGYLDYKEMKVKKKDIKYPWACPQIFQRMAIWWDGTLLPCNHDDDGLLSLGNVNEMNVKDGWHSASLMKLRETHKNGMAHEVSACDGCYLRDSEILKLVGKEAALQTDG